MSPWFAAIIGGVLIGLSATLLLLLNGRIAGVSGILGGLGWRRRSQEWSWRVAFLGGLMGAGASVMHLLGPLPRSPAGVSQLLIAGILVGFGTSLGNGCTSGHGVCGLGRLSLRSLVAVAVFMATAIATVYAVRHIGGAS